MFQSLIMLRVGQALNATLLLGYYRHLLSLPQQFFDTMRVGEMLSRMGDAVRIQAFINSGVLNLALSALVMLFWFGAMFFFAWQLAVLSAAMAAGYAILYWVVNRINRFFEKRQMESGAALAAELTPGKLMTCYSLSGHLVGPIQTLLGMNRTIQSALIAADRLFEIMDLEAEADKGKVELPAGQLGDIRLEKVTFKYLGRTETLREVSLTIPSGNITAIIGESSSGKSTFLALLQRLYPLDSGKIYFGETDIRFIRAASLRRHIAAVSQKMNLLAGTIAENIALGEFPPNLPKVERICRELGLAVFIDALPKGYDTLLNENATNLSGGQRQRIAIARALYADVSVLLLDEPTASLDAEAEDKLTAVIRRLRKEGKTIVAAGHRGRLLQIADQTLLICKGRLLSSDV